MVASMASYQPNHQPQGKQMKVTAEKTEVILTIELSLDEVSQLIRQHRYCRLDSDRVMSGIMSKLEELYFEQRSELV